MNVILLEKVGKLGNLGDQVNVKAGFGRNFLIPYGKAVPATKSNVEEFESRRGELEKLAHEKRGQADGRAAELAEITVTISANAGEEGKLFGSIGTRDIAEAISSAGVAVTKSEIRLPEGVIRELGEYEVNVQVHSDVMQAVKVHIIPQQ